MSRTRNKPLLSVATMIVLFVFLVVAVVILAVFGVSVLAEDFFAQFEE